MDSLPHIILNEIASFASLKSIVTIASTLADNETFKDHLVKRGKARKFASFIFDFNQTGTLIRSSYYLQRNSLLKRSRWHVWEFSEINESFVESFRFYGIQAVPGQEFNAQECLQIAQLPVDVSSPSSSKLDIRDVRGPEVIELFRKLVKTLSPNYNKVNLCRIADVDALNELLTRLAKSGRTRSLGICHCSTNAETKRIFKEFPKLESSLLK